MASIRPFLLCIAAIVAGLASAGAAAGTATNSALLGPWPDADALADIEGRPTTFPTTSPFTLADLAVAEGATPALDAVATLYLPPGASAQSPVPAVVLLHGAGGVLAARERTYARQYAAMGIAALVVDSFAARRDMAGGFIERLINITETMLLADAHAGLRHLAEMAEIEAERVALVGFSYGGMTAVLAAYAQVAEAFLPAGPRFAAHVSYYGPCLARFTDTRATGAPVLMLLGGEDAITDRARCAEILDDLRRGGAVARLIVYDGAYHQWDGAWHGPRMSGRDLSPCRLRVRANGAVRDRTTWLPMLGPFTRRLILGACVGREGYLIGRDDAVRARSDRDVGRFLAEALAR